VKEGLSNKYKFMVTIPAEITKVQRLKNRTVNISFNTDELEPNVAGEILGMSDFCYITMKPEVFTAKELSELDEMKSDTTFGKTLSKRMRNTLYVVYKNNNIDESFETYYAKRMEQLMDLLKEEIDS